MKSYTAAGIVGIVSGLAFFGVGGFVLNQTLDKQAASEQSLGKIERSCREQLVKIGKVTPSLNNVLEVDFGEIADPLKALGDATAMLAMCPTRTISDACLGVGCGQAAGPSNYSLHMVVKLAGTKK
jgi:hypothetical protein